MHIKIRSERARETSIFAQYGAGSFRSRRNANEIGGARGSDW